MDDKKIDNVFLRGTPGTALCLSSPSKISSTPKFIVQIYIHEEVSSTQERKGDIDDITSHVFIEGTIHIQIQPPNEVQNQTILLEIFDQLNKDNTCFRLNKKVVKKEGGKFFVSIPKSTVGQILVASYISSFNKKGMPILIQSKVIRSGINTGRFMIAVQVRSNLNNIGGMKKVILAISLPPTVKGNTLEITKERGHYDSLKRIVKWKFNELLRGDSLMVGARVDAVNEIYFDRPPTFPILFCCQSYDDIISLTKVYAYNIEGNLAGLKINKHCSFRLVHRVP